jgi:7-cyano-7-deazaguanine synthase
MKNAVILLSGGIDSTTLLHYVKKQVKVRNIHALSFIYGQKHSREIAMAKWQAKSVGVAEHRIIDISFFGDLIAGGSALTDHSIVVPDLSEIRCSQRTQPPTYVPNRNMVLLSITAAYAEAQNCGDVFYGAQAQDEYGYWDCTAGFVRRMNGLLSLNRRKPVTIHAPFARKSKSQVLRIGLAIGVNYSHTWSCYRGKLKPCGKCPSCVERTKAFAKVSSRDPLHA